MMTTDRSERIRRLRLCADKLKAYIDLGALIRAEEACSVASLRKFKKWLGDKIPDSTPGSREGNIDFVVRRISKEFGPFEITEVPELLSAVGSLIDSVIVLETESIIERYREIMERSYCSGIDMKLLMGYRPHVDLIRSFPRSFYDHPRYLAPVEDLLDSIAMRHYLGKQPGDAENGAVGWLVTHSLATGTKKTKETEFVSQLSSGLKHWSSPQINHAIEVWHNIVSPKLQQFNGVPKSQIEDQRRSTQK